MPGRDEDDREVGPFLLWKSGRGEQDERQEMNRADGGADIVMKHTHINMGGPKMAQETDEERFARTALSSVEITDRESAAVQKTQHRVTLESILAKIVHCDFEHPARHPHMTLCVITTDNGYIVVGKSVPADPDNY